MDCDKGTSNIDGSSTKLQNLFRSKSSWFNNNCDNNKNKESKRKQR